MFDIENSDSLTNYLLERGVVSPDDSVSFEILKGGVSCKVLRVTTSKIDIVIKQAREKLMVTEDWFSDVGRILIERDCLEIYNKIVPQVVPELIFSDDENFLYAMSAAPARAVMWKTELMNGCLNTSIAEKLGDALANIHCTSLSDKAIQEKFKDTKFFEELRLDPYLVTSRNRNPEVAEELTEVLAFLREERTVLVHGDFSPKNILVWDDKMMLLDFEVAHIGNPAFDLGFMLTHFLLKAVVYPERRDDFLGLINSFLDAYFAVDSGASNEKLFKQTVSALGGIVLARVDGKSPVEYIKDDSTKKQVRGIAYRLLKEAQVDRSEFNNFLKNILLEQE